MSGFGDDGASDDSQGVIHGTIELDDGRSKQYRVVEEGKDLQILVRLVRNNQVEDVLMKLLHVPAGYEAFRDGQDIVVRVFSRTGLFPARRHRF